MMEPQDTYARGRTVTLVGMAANILLMAVKIPAGILTGSQALVADGIHSFSDLFSDGVVLVGLKWGCRSEDKDHPFGHRRIETLAALVVGLTLLAAALFMAWCAARDIVAGGRAAPESFALVIAAISIVSKELLFRYTRLVGRRLNSLALISNAWHHRSDALSSVAVLVGVAAAGLRPGWGILDAWAALIVSALVGKVGISFVVSSLKELIDTAPDPLIVDMINKCAGSVSGVENIHDVRARTSGGKVFVEVHVGVDASLSVREGHCVAKAVEKCLIEEVPHMEKAIIHVDPVEKENQA